VIDEISIIIPTLNEANYLPRLLESIAKQTFAGRLQVIVVDGHSKDKTVALARAFTVSVQDLLVIEAERGVGHQRNVGARGAKYGYLLFLDADVVLPPRLLEQLVAKVCVTGPFVAGVMHLSEDMNLGDRGFLVLAYMLILVSWIARLPVSTGDFLLTTQENHQQVGGFVEGAILGEDTDYGLRSVKAGAKYRFYLWPKVIGSDRRARKMGRMRLLLLWSKGFLHVLKHGPIFPGQGFEYPFGDYDSHE
jgi:glycosyltransferase involved in cell wall biosynthesis